MTSTGYTVLDAARNAIMQSDRRLFFPQSKIIIIGEEMARTGIASLLDFFDRDPEPRRLAWVLVSKGKASEIIHAKHPQEKIPARAIEGMVESSSVSSMAVKVNLNDLLKSISLPTTDPITGRIELINSDDGERKNIKVTGAAVFKTDKLIGFLDCPETRGLNWVLGKVASGIIVVKSPKEESKNVSLEIIRANSKITPEIQDGEVTITVEIKEEGNLAEQMSDVELTNVEMFTILEQRQAQVIKNEIESVLNKAQKEWEVDIFGFGEAVHRKYPREWKELKGKWRDTFPEIKVQVKVDAQLRTGGLSTAPTRPK